MLLKSTNCWISWFLRHGKQRRHHPWKTPRGIPVARRLIWNSFQKRKQTRCKWSVESQENKPRHARHINKIYSLVSWRKLDQYRPFHSLQHCGRSRIHSFSHTRIRQNESRREGEEDEEEEEKSKRKWLFWPPHLSVCHSIWGAICLNSFRWTRWCWRGSNNGNKKKLNVLPTPAPFLLFYYSALLHVRSILVRQTDREKESV